jgi:hypothetical protein
MNPPVAPLPTDEESQRCISRQLSTGLLAQAKGAKLPQLLFNGHPIAVLQGCAHEVLERVPQRRLLVLCSADGWTRYRFRLH